MAARKPTYGESIITVPASNNGQYQAPPPGRTPGINVTPGQFPTAFSGAGGPPPATTGVNLGTGVGVYYGNTGSNMTFRSLVAGPGISVLADTPAVGDIQISTGGGGLPAEATGAGAGAGAVSFVAGTDSAGQITVNAAGVPAATSAVVTVIFSIPFATAPYITFSPANANAAALSGTAAVYVTSSSISFAINSGTAALVTGTTYAWNYQVTI